MQGQRFCLHWSHHQRRDWLQRASHGPPLRALERYRNRNSRVDSSPCFKLERIFRRRGSTTDSLTMHAYRLTMIPVNPFGCPSAVAFWRNRNFDDFLLFSWRATARATTFEGMPGQLFRSHQADCQSQGYPKRAPNVVPLRALERYGNCDSYISQSQLARVQRSKFQI